MTTTWATWSVTIAITIGVVVVILGYFLGLWDRVEFEYKTHYFPGDQERFVEDDVAKKTTDNSRKSNGKEESQKESKTQKEVYLIVGRTFDPLKRGRGGDYCRFARQTKKCVEKVVAPSSKGLFEGENGECTLVSLHMTRDDDNDDETTVFSMGWVVATHSWEETKTLARDANAVCREFDIVPIRMDSRASQPAPVLAARIPWRHYWTPVVAPWLHWKKGFAAYEQRQDEHQDDPAVMEVYVVGPKQRPQWIDFVILMGDTQSIWDDLTATTTTSNAETTDS